MDDKPRIVQVEVRRSKKARSSTMTHRYCIVQDEGRVRVVTLNRPEVLNSVSWPLAEELVGLIEAADADPDTVSAWAERVFARWAKNPYALDNHLRPQTEFLLPGMETYRLEDGLGTMVADLNARFDLGLDHEVPRKLTSHDKGIPSSKVPITPEVRARVHEFYADDYRVLGYPER
jgi:hypothetical protein